MASTGTRHAGIYQHRIQGPQWVEPTDDEQARWVTPGIRAVKAARLDEANALLSAAAQRLIERGAGAVLMACTEIPLALARAQLGVPLIDATDELAAACVAWALAPEGSSPYLAAPVSALSFRPSSSVGR